MKKPTVFWVPRVATPLQAGQTQAQEAEAAFVSIRQYLLACRADPGYGVLFSGVDYLEPYLHCFPEERVWIAELVQARRCGTVGSYARPRLERLGGEALIRNIQEGLSFFQTLTGDLSPFFLLEQAAGYPAQLPQLFFQFGILASVIPSLSSPEEEQPGAPLFLWTAPSGAWIYGRRTDSAPLTRLNGRGGISEMLLHCMESAAPLSVDLIVDSRPLPQMKIVGSCEPLAEGEPAAVVSGQGANIYFSCI
ncbi:MAG: hypothetical protein RBU29_16745, partial [bacterium]|nr:hypothetical protein [bacterium]